MVSFRLATATSFVYLYLSMMAFAFVRRSGYRISVAPVMAWFRLAITSFVYL
jgi:hypothetical protein